MVIYVLQCKNKSSKLADIFVFKDEKEANEELEKANKEYSYTKLESFFIGA